MEKLETRLILSLIPDAASNLKLGSSYNLEVIKRNEEGIEVNVADSYISKFDCIFYFMNFFIL